MALSWRSSTGALLNGMPGGCSRWATPSFSGRSQRPDVQRHSAGGLRTGPDVCQRNERLRMISRLLSAVRLPAFDLSTERGRSHERYRRAGFTSVLAFSARLMGVATALVTVPLTLNYLGVESYGLWLTLSSVALLLGFTDLGIGNGVLNALSEAHGHDDRSLARDAVASGFFMLCLVGVSLIVVFAVIYPFVPWARASITSRQLMRSARPALRRPSSSSSGR